MASFQSVANYAVNIVKSATKETTQKEILESDTPQEAQEKQLYNAQQTKNKVAGVASATVGTAIALTSFVYNTSIKFTRFGQRGQDIADQNRLQDKMVNLGLTVGASVAGLAISAATGNVFGVVASTIALVGIGVNEAINVSAQNAQYEYNKSIDAFQTKLVQERAGRTIYNSSRR